MAQDDETRPLASELIDEGIKEVYMSQWCDKNLGFKAVKKKLKKCETSDRGSDYWYDIQGDLSNHSKCGSSS